MKKTPEQIATQANLDSIRDGFLGRHGLREYRWSYRSIQALFSLGMADRDRIADVIDLVFDKGFGGTLLRHTGPGNVFDHPECFGRAKQPLFLCAFPYQINAEAYEALTAIRSIGLTVTVGERAPNWYGHGTIPVVVTHWPSVEWLCHGSRPQATTQPRRIVTTR